MNSPGSDSSSRSAQEKIDAIHRPRWCVDTEKGLLYWDLVCAAIRNDAQTIGDLLKKDPDCPRLEFWYTPPLNFAVREGSLDATRVLWKAYPFDEVSDLIQMADDRGHDGIAAYLSASLGPAAEGSDLRLLQAVEARDRGQVTHLLAAVPGIAEHRDRQGRTALHLAAIGGDGDTVAMLLAGGIDVDAVDHRGFRAAHYAFWKNQYWGSDEGGAALLQMLLDAGAADSPALAAARGDHGALRAFVEADPAAANEGEGLQKRPLSAAAERGHREMVRYLLDRGADPTLPEGRQCPHGFALMAAAVKGDVEMARWLLEAGADPNGGVDSSGTPAIRASSDAMRGLLYGYGGRPVTAWDFAQRGDLQTLAVILNYCEDPFSAEKSEFLTTPYTAVVSGCNRKLRRKESTVAHEAMLSMLLRRRFPMPEVLTECKEYLYNVPHMTRQLLEHGLDPNLPDWHRRTPLHDLCVDHRDPAEAEELLRMFLEHGADINAVEEADRSTPLGMAARAGRPRLVELLLENGADPNGAGEDWARPLAWAQRRGHGEVADMLRRRGAR